MDGIAETAMMFVTQAAKHSDRVAFNIQDAFAILYDTIDLFDGAHFRSAKTRRHLVEAISPRRASQAIRYPSIVLSLGAKPSPSNGYPTSTNS